MYPEDLKYTKEHEWVKVEGGRGRVGITDYAQQELGDVVNVELPAVGRKLRQFGAFGVVESVKAVQDLNSPLSGTVSSVNEELRNTPELINQDPYGNGWLIDVELEHPAELDALMDAKAYQEYIATKG